MWLCQLRTLCRLLVLLGYGDGYLRLKALIDLTRINGVLDGLICGSDDDFRIHFAR